MDAVHKPATSNDDIRGQIVRVGEGGGQLIRIGLESAGDLSTPRPAASRSGEPLVRLAFCKVPRERWRGP